MPTQSRHRDEAPEKKKKKKLPGNSASSSSLTLVRTSGGTLPNGIPLELVLPAGSARLKLSCLNGQKAFPLKTATIGTQTYTPARVGSSWVHAIHFPPNAEEFGPVAELFAEISDFFQQGLKCPPGTVELMTAFVIATWFIDLIEVPPLWVLAPDAVDRKVLLERLFCVCRRALLLADCTRATLGSLPSQLKPTVLFEAGRAFTASRVLEITSRHGFYVARSHRAMDNALAVGVVSADPPDTDIPVLQLMFPPGSARDWIVNTGNLEKRSTALQSALAYYRLEQYRQVPHPVPELKAGTSTAQLLGASLTAAIAENTVRAQILAALQQQDSNLQAERSTELHAVALEALLAPCHKQETDMLVGELSELANAILEGRGEAPRFTPRAFGQFLRTFGLANARRTNQGWCLSLDLATRKSIHRLASIYGVETPARAGCEECKLLRPGEKQFEIGERSEHGELAEKYAQHKRKYAGWQDYLTEAGCPLLPAFVSPIPRTLELSPASGECWVKENEGGGVLFFLELELCALAACAVDRFELQEVQGRSKSQEVQCWIPKDFRFLDSDEVDSYLRGELPGWPTPALNRLAEKHTELSAGKTVKGVLLGDSLDRIPPELQAPLTVIISVYDTLRNVASLRCPAGLQRKAVRKKPAPEAAPAQSSNDDDIPHRKGGLWDR